MHAWYCVVTQKGRINGKEPLHHMQTAKVQTSLCIHKDSQEPMLSIHVSGLVSQGKTSAKELGIRPCYGARHAH